MQLPLEREKEEVLHMRKSRKKRNEDRKYVKWLGVIFDDSVDFDMHWKSRIVKARKSLGALSGVGASQWGMCLGGCQGSKDEARRRDEMVTDETVRPGLHKSKRHRGVYVEVVILEGGEETGCCVRKGNRKQGAGGERDLYTWAGPP